MNRKFSRFNKKGDQQATLLYDFGSANLLSAVVVFMCGQRLTCDDNTKHSTK
jgi:hypothetical protein